MLEHEFINRHLKYESATGSTEINLNQVYVPVVANFHIPLSDRLNVLTALGVGMILNTEKKRDLDAETELVCDNRWECSFVGKAGIEILTKRRMLLLVDYHLSPRANYYYDCAERTENFSIQRLGIEFSVHEEGFLLSGYFLLQFQGRNLYFLSRRDGLSIQGLNITFHARAEISL